MRDAVFVGRTVQHEWSGGTQAASYVYGGAKADLSGRGFLGFRWIEATTQATGLKHRTEFRQDWPYVGLPSLVRRAQSTGAVLSQTATVYGCANPASGADCAIASGNRYFPFISQSVEAGSDLSGAPLPRVTTDIQYDAYGNATGMTVSIPDDGHSKATTNTHIVDRTAAPTMPSVWASNIAEIAPRQKPSHSA